MTIRMILGVTCLLLHASAGFSQRVELQYDAAGNRVLRQIVLSAALKDATADSSWKQDLKEETGSGQIRILPNPTKGIIEIQYSNGDGVIAMKVKVISANGTVIYDKRIVENSIQIDLSGQPDGNYILWMEHNSKVMQYKVVKRN